MNPAIELLFNTLSQFLWIYSTLLIVRILLSWFPQINWFNPPFSILSQLTDPYLNIFRGIIPPLGGIDLSPILAFISLSVLQAVLGALYGALAGQAMLAVLF